MADYHNFVRSAEEALSRLANFRTQNPVRIITTPAGRSPSPPPGSPMASVQQQQSPPTPSVPQSQPSCMTIPQTAYASAYTSAHQVPQANHVLHLATQSPSPQPPSPQAYEPLIYPEPLECMTYRMVYDRVYLLLRANLTEWWASNTDALHQVTTRLTKAIIGGGIKGMFGPDGLQSLYQISMYTGQEGIYCYMCLAVQSEHSGLSIFLKGDLCKKDGKDPTHDEEMLLLCKDGFDKGIAKLYSNMVTEG